MARRMTSGSACSWRGAAPLALFAFLPMVSGAREGPGLQDRAQEGPDRLAQGARARARLRRRRLHAPDQRAAGRHHGAADQAGAPAGQPGPQARRARAHPGGPAPRAAAARPPARPPRRGARRALQAARRALQGRPARPRDRRARVRRLRRPARAPSSCSASPPGRADHRHRGQGQEGGDRDREAARPAREARAGRRRADRGRGRRRSPPSRTTRRPPRPLPGGARRQVLAAGQDARGPPQPRGRPARARRPSARCSPRCRPRASTSSSAPAGPIRPGSGGLVWPVNALVSPFGMRWGRLHAGVDIAAPAARRSAPRGPGRVVLLGWTGGYGNYALHPAHGRAVHLLPRTSRATPPPAGRASRRARSSATSAARATASATTCTSRRASTARRSTRLATSRRSSARPPCRVVDPGASGSSQPVGTCGGGRAWNGTSLEPEGRPDGRAQGRGRRCGSCPARGSDVDRVGLAASTTTPTGRHLGDKHPWALGRPAREVWAEIWADIGRASSGAAHRRRRPGTRRCCCSSSAAASARRPTTFSYSPLRDDDGRRRVLCVVSEETEPRDRRAPAAHAARARRRPRPDRARRGCARGRAPRCDNRSTCRSRSPTSSTATGGARARGGDRGRAGRPAAPRRARRRTTAWPWSTSPRATRAATGRRTRWRRAAAPARGRPPPIARSSTDRRPGPDAPRASRRRRSTRYRPLDDELPRLPRAGRRPDRGEPRQRRAYEAERQRAEALAELDRAKTDVLHQRQPRVPHAADPDARPGRGRAARPARRRRARGARSARGVTATRCACSSWSTRCSTSRASRPAAAGACYEPTDLAALTAELASVFRSAVERAGLALDRRLPAAARAGRVDREMWEKIVLNLLSNAFKFTFEGGITVALRATRPAARELDVADTGIGIAADELPRLFERFHRVAGARSRTHEGTGIGLALVAGARRAARRRVAAESALGEGTTFTVTSRSAPRTCPGPRSRAPSGDGAPAASSRRRCAGWPTSARRCAAGATAPRTRPPTGAARRAARAGRRRQRRHARVRRALLAASYDVEAVADGAAALERGARARRPRPGPHRRDDARPRRLRAAGALRADPRHARRAGDHALRARRRGGARRGPRGRRRRLPGQAVLGARAARPRARQPRPRARPPPHARPAPRPAAARPGAPLSTSAAPTTSPEVLEVVAERARALVGAERELARLDGAAVPTERTTAPQPRRVALTGAGGRPLRELLLDGDEDTGGVEAAAGPHRSSPWSPRRGWRTRCLRARAPDRRRAAAQPAPRAGAAARPRSRSRRSTCPASRARRSAATGTT